MLAILATRKGTQVKDMAVCALVCKWARIAFFVLVLSRFIACPSTLASVEHLEGGSGFATYLDAMARDGNIQDNGHFDATNLDVLVTALRTRIAADPTSDKLRVQLAWFYEVRAHQAPKLQTPGKSEDADAVIGRCRRDSISELAEAIRLNPQNDLAWFLQGLIRIETGETDAGIADCRRASQIGRRTWEYWVLAGVLNATEQYTDAAAAAEKALEVDPRYARALIELGIARAKLGRSDAARQAADEAIHLQPKDGRTLQQAARIYRLNGNLTNSETLLQRANVAAPGLWETFSLMARNACDQGRLAQAAENAQAALRLNPRDAESFCIIGRVHNARGEFEDALHAFQKAGRLAPKISGHQINLGLVLERLNRFAEAEAAFQLAFTLAPGKPEILSNFLLRRGRNEESVALLQRACDACPSNWNIRIRLADVCLNRGDPRAAEKLLQQGVESFPNVADLWGALAHVKAKTDPSGVPGCAQRALALCPTNYSAHFALGYWNKTFQHDMLAAKTNYEAAIQDAPGRKEPLVGLGVMFGASGDLDASERYFKQALEIDPKDSGVLTSLGYGRYLRRDYPGAVAYHERAIAADSKNGLAHYNMALAFLETGEYARGLTHWHKAKEVGYKVDARLLQELEKRQKAAVP